MKKLLFLCLLLCVGCSKCFGPEPKLDKITSAPYAPNEIILDVHGLSEADRKAQTANLVMQGFEKKDSCNCSSGVELWGSNRDIDILGVIRGAAASMPTQGGSKPLSPNSLIDLPNIREPQPQTPNQPDTPRIRPSSGNSVRIVILDTGVEPSLSYNSMLWRRPTTPLCSQEGMYGLDVNIPVGTASTEPLDLFGHGTHINGIISGIPSNAGSQSNVQFEQLNVKITRNSDHKTSLFNAVCGLYYGLDRGGQVFNLSWGYADDEEPQLIKSFLETVKNKNVIIAVAAGNDSTNNDTTKFWPACFSEQFPEFVISVGGYNAYYTPNTPSSPKYELYNKSNFGKAVDIFAPGVNVVSTFINPPINRAVVSGTSMATAYVSRVAAIILGKNPSATPQQIKSCIIDAADSETIGGNSMRFLQSQKAIDNICPKTN